MNSRKLSFLIALVILFYTVQGVFAEGSDQIGNIHVGLDNTPFTVTGSKFYAYAQAGEKITVYFPYGSTYVVHPNGSVTYGSSQTIIAKASDNGFFTIVVPEQDKDFGSWDISVFPNASSASAIPGRMFTYELAIGKTHSNIAVYYLTEDGYIYYNTYENTDFYSEGVLFANNRGLINQSTGTSLYMTPSSNGCGSICPAEHSFTYGGITYSYKLPNFMNGISAVDNRISDSLNDKLHRLFVNYPDQALLNALGVATPRNIANVNSFTYNGSKSASKIGVGGDFAFDLSGSSSCTLTINIPGDTTGNKAVTISDYCHEGVNTFHWDGKDHYGNVAPIGTYTAQLKIASSEVHFMQIDVEYVVGLRIKLMNHPSGDSDYSSQASLAYYDNRPWGGINALSGQNTAVTPYSGSYDTVFVDIWTSYAPQKGLHFYVFKVNNGEGKLNGKAFYDANSNGVFDSGDWALPNQTVNVYSEDGSTLIKTLVTDSNGNYSAALEGDTVYKVITYLPDSRMKSTTGNMNSTVTIRSDTTTTINYGYVLNRDAYLQNINVKKVWIDNLQTHITPAVTLVVSANSGSTYIAASAGNIGLSPVPAISYNSTSQTYSCNGLPRYVMLNKVITELKYGISETRVNGYFSPVYKSGTNAKNGESIINQRPIKTSSTELGGNPQEVRIGELITYSISYKNVTGAVQNNIVVRDKVPTGTDFYSMKGYGGGTTSHASDGALVWKIPTLAAGKTLTVYFSVRVTGRLKTGSVVKNTGSVTAGNETVNTNEVSTIVNYVKISVINN